MPAVELRGITKKFSTVKALNEVSLKAYGGECLGLLGENGAGKSTLMKVLSGVWPQDSFEGQILVQGEEVRFDGPKAAADAGIFIIHQELSLFEELSVAENIFIRKLPSSMGVLHSQSLFEQSQKILDRLNSSISPQEKLKNLSVGERQLVEIARAFTQPVKVIIFDEPTSALSDREIENLFLLIDDFKRNGVACLYISHKLSEIHRLCERVTVLRDGQSVASFRMEDSNDQYLIEAMVGRKIEAIFPPKPAFHPDRKILLEVKNLSYSNPNNGHSLLQNISFDVRRGEIFGIAGLMGSGRSELLLALFGALKAQKTSGEIFLEGKPLQVSHPRDAIAAGLGLVTEDRKTSGLVLDLDVRANLTLPILHRLSTFMTIRSQQELSLVNHYREALRIKTPDAFFKVRHLSGGNQQKVIIARWLSTQPKILLLDEPTRGIDVRAKAEIYSLMRELVEQGLTLILVSSELPEVVSLSDRVLVMREGSLAGILEGSAISQESIMARAAA